MLNKDNLSKDMVILILHISGYVFWRFELTLPQNYRIVLGRIMAIDYGQKRTGIAVTDPLQLIASRLDTVASADIWSFLTTYFVKEQVDRVLVGYPVKLNHQPSEALRFINPFIREFRKRFPAMELEQVDERFTSQLAQKAILAAGVKKSDRQNKALTDGVSATIMLQSWLEKNRLLK